MVNKDEYINPTWSHNLRIGGGHNKKKIDVTCKYNNLCLLRNVEFPGQSLQGSHRSYVGLINCRCASQLFQAKMKPLKKTFN